MSNTNPRTDLATIHDVSAVDQQRMSALAEQLLPRWPKDLNRQSALDVARVALAYNLDPFMDELIPYQGKPYVTIAGRIRIADQHPMFDGYDLEPATDVEHRALGAHEAESVWKCIVYRKDRSRPTKAYGRAGGPGETNPVAKRWLPELAQKRAMHRALRAAFPLALPGAEEHLSADQLRRLHAVDQEYGIDRDVRHHTLTETFDVESSADLTSAQASVYMDERTVDSHQEIEVEYTPPVDLKSQFLAELPKVNDRRDLSGYKARIQAADLWNDPDVYEAFADAYERLGGKRRGQQDTHDDQPTLGV